MFYLDSYREKPEKISSETRRPTGTIKAKFHMKPLWSRETSLYTSSGSHDQDGHHPIYGKNTLKIFSRTKGPKAQGLGMQH